MEALVSPVPVIVTELLFPSLIGSMSIMDGALGFAVSITIALFTDKFMVGTKFTMGLPF